jgi:hypothetical protein
MSEIASREVGLRTCTALDVDCKQNRRKRYSACLMWTVLEGQRATASPHRFGRKVARLGHAQRCIRSGTVEFSNQLNESGVDTLRGACWNFREAEVCHMRCANCRLYLRCSHDVL